MPVNIQENVSIAPFTFYKIGGPVRYFAEAKNSEELREAVTFATERKIPIFILGAGSNILVSDKGYGGLVVRLSGREVRAEGNEMLVGAGVMMARAATEASKAELTGFEWAIGVPGTVGGSVRGNAGCFGSEMKDVVERVEVFDTLNSKRSTLNPKQCEFGYRDSIFKKHPEWIIISATLKLRKDDFSKIQERIREISAERAEKQDIGTKSCGCIFKNVSWIRKDINKEKLLAHFPELAQFKDQPNIPASFLIDSVGLKSRRVGHVFISPKHANFFINDGGATTEEVIMLIGMAKDVVRRKFRIMLEEEIQYVGF
jgi:UDP-N-acetylmuramate dehydrogenase